MSVGVVQVQGQATLVQPKKVYYTGSDVLRTGYALCYDAEAALGEGQGDRGSAVVQPTTALLPFFAGVVTPEYDGVQGPGYVDVFPPRSVGSDKINVALDAGAFTKGQVAVPQNASYLLETAAIPAAGTDANLDWRTVMGTIVGEDATATAGDLVPVMTY